MTNLLNCNDTIKNNIKEIIQNTAYLNQLFGLFPKEAQITLLDKLDDNGNGIEYIKRMLENQDNFFVFLRRLPKEKQMPFISRILESNNGITYIKKIVENVNDLCTWLGWLPEEKRVPLLTSLLDDHIDYIKWMIARTIEKDYLSGLLGSLSEQDQRTFVANLVKHENGVTYIKLLVGHRDTESNWSLIFSRLSKDDQKILLDKFHEDASIKNIIKRVEKLCTLLHGISSQKDRMIFMTNLLNCNDDIKNKIKEMIKDTNNSNRLFQLFSKYDQTTLSGILNNGVDNDQNIGFQPLRY